ncbi:MAG: metallopeptidase TldD-related protein [Bacilli bacterium]
MKKVLQSILHSIPEITAYEIQGVTDQSQELFFVKRRLEMNRSKRVTHYGVTIYREVEHNGTRMLGSSRTLVSPSMSRPALEQAFEKAFYAAQFALVPMFELPTSNSKIPPSIPSNLADRSLQETAIAMAEAVYEADHFQEGFINSCEVFVHHKMIEFVNSNGVDLQTESYEAEVEYVCTWKGIHEEIERYDLVHLANFDSNILRTRVEETLLSAKGRAEAQPMPFFKDISVLLRTDAISDLMRYFSLNTNVQSIFQKISVATPGFPLQGEKIRGDKITLTIDPYLSGSTLSSPFDVHGCVGAPTTILKDGIVENLWGSTQYAQYLNAPYSVDSNNLILSGGTLDENTLKQSPYVEIVSFSDLQVDEITGAFGGEIRLAYYYDGAHLKPVSGGAFSGNINECRENWYFSQSMNQENSFFGPKYMLLPHMTIMSR